MTTQRVVKKNLAGQEDILYGEGSVVQSRNGGNFTINKVRTVYPVNSIAERDALDTTKFTKCRLYFADGSTPVDYEYTSGSWQVAANNSFLTFDTLDDALSSNKLRIGSNIWCEERSAGQGGGALWRVVDAATVVINPYYIVQGTGSNTNLAFILHLEGLMNLAAFGAKGDAGTTNNTPILEAAAAVLTAVSITSKGGVYNFSTTPTLPSGFTTLITSQTLITGATAAELNAVLINEGNIRGYAVADELRYSGIEIVAGTLRQNATTRTQWDWIKDASHEPVGVDDSVAATASGSTLTINFTKTYSRVISLVCGPDESLANGLNMSVGASVGLSSIDIKATAQVTLAAAIRYNGASWDVTYGAGQGGTGTFNANISSVGIAGANITVDHDWLGGADIQLTADTNGGAVTPWIPVIRSVSDTQFVMNFIDYTGAFVSPADTSMSFRVSKQFSQGIRLDGVDNGATLDLDQGNIWFYGIFEV